MASLVTSHLVNGVVDGIQTVALCAGGQIELAGGSEVGMYLCMARIAHREGYPEIGLYWEKAAWEEAEHAAKFAELLGEDLEPNMKATTKDNLAWRVDCEFGATQGKFDLASCAKKNGLDAIHDTVHEMARDEARHGVALKGMLERYFK